LGVRGWSSLSVWCRHHGACETCSERAYQSGEVPPHAKRRDAGPTYGASDDGGDWRDRCAESGCVSVGNKAEDAGEG
jgi:hypothetical protein